MIRTNPKPAAVLSLSMACAVAGLAMTANANLITNGSLEAPYKFVGAGVQGVTPTGWIDAGPGHRGNLVNNTGQVIPFFPLAQDGDQFWQLVSGIPLAQTFHVGAAGLYNVSWYENDNLQAPPTFHYSYGVSLLSGATTVSSATFGGSGPGGGWIARSEQLSLAPGDYTLSFAGANGSFLDNIAVNAVTVPETSTWLFGAALTLPLGAAGVRGLARQRAAVRS